MRAIVHHRLTRNQRCSAMTDHIPSTTANGQERIITAYADAAAHDIANPSTNSGDRSSSAYIVTIAVTATIPKASTNTSPGFWIDSSVFQKCLVSAF